MLCMLKLIFDRELTKCAVLGIDMLLLLGSSQNGILCTTQYTVNIYWVCNLHNCIHLHLCTCTCIHLHTCVHLHILLRSCNFFHIFIEFFAVCTEFDLCSGLVKHFLLRFSNGQTKEKIVQIL